MPYVLISRCVDDVHDNVGIIGPFNTLDDARHTMRHMFEYCNLDLYEFSHLYENSVSCGRNDSPHRYLLQIWDADKLFPIR